MFRKTLSVGGILLLAGAMILIAPTAVRAQHGGHGGGGHGGGFGGGHYSGGGHVAGVGGYHGAGHYGGGYYGNHYYGGRYYGGFGRWGGYYPYYGYYGGYPDYGSYGYAVPSYADPAITIAPSTDAYQAFYPPANPATPSDMHAYITVKAPADARIWIQNSLMTSSGAVREFVSPPLTRGVEYTYTILARWNENGHEVTRKQEVDVQAGSHAEVDFLAGSANAETTPLPRKG